MDEKPQRSPTAHVRLVFTVVGCVIVAAATARWLAYPKTYGEFGHYRGAAVEQCMNAVAPLHADSKKCHECHKDITEAMWKDVHEKVQCDTCHGPSGRHIDEELKVAVARPDAAPLVVDKTSQQCLTCHRRLVARPATFPQIDRDSHFKMLHLKSTDVECVECHDPHQPLFLDKNIKQARLHPLVNRCVDCHKHRQELEAKRPDDHPILFECSYCHKSVAKDHAERAHKEFECNVCHQVYPMSDRAVRIVTHRDPKFCLLCHSSKHPRDKSGPPSIEWPAHLEDVADNFEQDKNKVCMDCHEDAYHLKPEPAEIKVATTLHAAQEEKTHD